MTKYYSVLSTQEVTLMTLALQISSLFGLPIIRKCLNSNNMQFEALLFSMTFLASFMFHTCQIYETEFFLTELQWQRIDNIFTISSFQIVILHLCGAILDQDLILKLTTLFSTIIIQQKDPWNFTYTVTPLITYLFIGISLRIYHRDKRQAKYNKKNIFTAAILLLIGSYFFLAGLDQDNDYLRINHAAWHIFGSGFAYFCLKAVQVKSLTFTQLPQKQAIQ